MSSLYNIGHYSLEQVRDFYDHAGIWWRADPQEPDTHAARVSIVNHLCGRNPLTVLDLGSGGGATAAAMADAGHHVTAVEFTLPRSVHAQQLSEIARSGSLRIIEADFYTVSLPEKYDLITYWDGFGVGTDNDQRVLLKRIAQEWLNHSGCLIMDVFNPFKASTDAGNAVRLPPLDGVPGSVEMFNRHIYDPVNSRWIDEWEPVDYPEQTTAQMIRCYSPVDLALLLEGTGLKIIRIEQDGVEIDLYSQGVTRDYSTLADWSYLVQIVKQ